MLDLKNALFNQHSRQYAVPLLWQMLPVLTTDPDATTWFGRIGNRGFHWKPIEEEKGWEGEGHGEALDSGESHRDHCHYVATSCKMRQLEDQFILLPTSSVGVSVYYSILIWTFKL